MRLVGRASRHPSRYLRVDRVCGSTLKARSRDVLGPRSRSLMASEWSRAPPGPIDEVRVLCLRSSTLWLREILLGAAVERTAHG